MTLKGIKVINVFVVFGLCFITHFLFDWFPNTFFSIFFPVNESIWEHMKMLYSAIIIAGISDYFFIKKTGGNTNNFLTSLFVSAILSIPAFLIIYLPFYYSLGENMALNLIVMFIAIVISQIISFYILKYNNLKKLNYISLMGIVLVYIIFGILTYYPIPCDLFFDPLKEKYGINSYVI